MTTHSCILAWEIPRTEEDGGMQSTGLQRVGHDGATHTHTGGHGDTRTRATRTWKRRRFRPSSRTSRCTWTGIRLEPCTLSTQGQEADPQVTSSCGPKHKAVYGAHPPSQHPLPRQNPGEPGPA